MNFERKTTLVDGLLTGYLEAGRGEPVILLHGGEFGASAELSWEHAIGALASRFRVLAPDMLGYGRSAKVIDFVDGRQYRIRHVAKFCEAMGVDARMGGGHFVGNSMGAVNLLVDATADAPCLPVRSLTLVCGGGQIERNEHASALYDYDASIDGMRRIVSALFADPSYSEDDVYVMRRHISATAPGAWEAVAAARFRRPGAAAPASPSVTRRYERIRVPTLVIEGDGDKLLPEGWSAELARQIPKAQSAVVTGAGHCPQIERPDVVNRMLSEFLATQITET